MRHVLLLSPAILLLAAAAASCGGSSSETPWPVEPEAVQFAPPGESATPSSIIIEERPDGGRPKKP